VFLETPRLRLRPFVPEDAEAVFRYRRDPDLMRYIPVGADKTIGDTRKLIDWYIAHQEKYGFSKWAVELRQTGELIGDSGLLLLEDGPDFELGYRLAREYWDRGFATECGRAWLEAAFSTFGLQRVVAFAHPEHAASIRVMAKLGKGVREAGALLWHGYRLVLGGLAKLLSS